ncbi:hypothetical protein D3C73_871240 [compost metagenome]
MWRVWYGRRYRTPAFFIAGTHIVFRIGPSPAQRSSVRGFWKTSASAKNVCAFCAFNASSAGLSSFTFRRPAAVFVVSAFPLLAWVIARLTITSSRSQSISPQSSATNSLVRRPVQRANCIMLRAWPERAPSTACCSSGLKGSTSSSFGGADLRE